MTLIDPNYDIAFWCLAAPYIALFLLAVKAHWNLRRQFPWFLGSSKILSITFSFVVLGMFVRHHEV